MPTDRSDLATPTLMRAARGTYARSIRAHLQAIGVDDLPRNGAFILFSAEGAADAREELPAGLGVSKQAVSQVIDVLVNRGFLDRNTDPSDRRRITLRLTERGHEVVTAVWQGTEAVDRQLAARMSPEEITAMRSGLMALADIKAASTASGAGVPRPPGAPANSRSSARSSPSATWRPHWPTTRRSGSRPSPTRAAATTGSPTASGSAST